MTNHQKNVVIRIVLAVITAVIAFVFPAGQWGKLALFAIPYFIVGYDVVLEAIEGILKGELFDETFLMTIATLGAFGVGEYPEAAGVMLFYQIGELFQDIAVGRSRRSIAALMDIRPEYAVIVKDGEEAKVAPEEVAIDDIIVVRPGEKIPLDGVIVEGMTTVNTAALTGESLPVDMAQGKTVISGSVNLTGLIRVRVTSLYKDSTVSKILELVENSSSKKARLENFITRFSKYYTPVVVVLAVIIALIPPVTFGQDWKTWIERALIFLMVSCPCALVVSVPLTFFGGIGRASREGILIKGANYLEALSHVDTFVFDKTGTLTTGVLQVVGVHPESGQQSDLLDLAALAESYSTHPIAASIALAHPGQIDKHRLGIVSELAGKGIRAVIDDKDHYVGNGSLMDDVGAHWKPCELVGTVVHVSRGDEYIGHITICDEAKPNAKEALTSLRKNGITQTVMLTGDSEAVADHIAREVGIDTCRSQLLPHDKVKVVEDLLQKGRKVAFVGDGINDAPVLARADVGIAMGALGSDAAIESADVVLMDDALPKLTDALKISKHTMRIARQNVVMALGIKSLILILTVFGLTNMWIAVFGDVGVLILATLNALRIMISNGVLHQKVRTEKTTV